MLDFPIFGQMAEMMMQWGSGNWGTGMGNWGGGGFMWMGPVLWLFILGLFVWLVVTLVTRSSGGGSGGRSNRSPLDILNERYARGEIDTEEFEQRRKILK